MGIEIPETMRAVQLTEYGGEGEPTFTVVDLPVPKPQPGYVLIKVEASPINPSDVSFLSGRYGVRKELPVVPGLEGSGTVVANGGGMIGWSLVGNNVAFAADNDMDGTWAEYAVAKATSCIKQLKDTDLDVASCSIVNPLTVCMFVERLKNAKAKAVVHTAAASQVGRMLNRACAVEKISVINIVRREAQIEALTSIGVPKEHVLVSTADDFDAKLAELCTKLNATMCFDAVSGSLAGRILAAMPDNSHLASYGSLSGEKISDVDTGDLIFHNKSVGGFWLPLDLAAKGLLSKYFLTNKVAGLVGTTLTTDISKRVPLEDALEGLRYYKKNMSAGKVIVKPHLNATDKAAEE